MNRYLLFAALLIATSSCKMQPSSDRHYTDGDESKVYKLRLKPEDGSQYYYDISNESEIKVESGEKKLDNLNKTHIGVYYDVRKDSAGNLVLHIRYDKIHIYTKNSDGETEMDAANAENSNDPVEKTLGALLSARIVATISPLGEVKTVTGYKEMVDRIMAGFSSMDENTRKIARGRLEQMVGDGIVKKNMNQLFKIFPDSAVHVGDRWKLSGQQKGELSLNSKNSFNLRSIDNGVALIKVEGELTSDSAATNLMGYEVTTNVKGDQKGEYAMDTRTGMLVSADLSTSVEGAMQVMGRDIPLTVDTKVKMNGRKLK